MEVIRRIMNIIYICIYKYLCIIICSPYYSILVRDSSVGIATDYGLDGPGIESRRGRDFPHLSISALGPTQPPILWIPDLSRE